MCKTVSANIIAIILFNIFLNIYIIIIIIADAVLHVFVRIFVRNLLVFHLIFLRHMPDRRVESHKILLGMIAPFVLPDEAESRTFQYSLDKAVTAMEVHSLSYLTEHVSVVHLVEIHPRRFPEVEQQDLADIGIRKSIRMPCCHQSAYQFDVNCSSERLDSEVVPGTVSRASGIVICFCCHHNSVYL